MKKILFTAACSPELKVIKSEIKNIRSSPLKKGTEGIFSFKSSFLLLGMGNYNTIYTLTKHLEKNEYDFIINIGVCGWMYKPPNPLSGALIDYKYIQISRIFNLSNKRELIVPIFFKFGVLESIACSEIPVYDSEDLGDENYVDMESFGFEYVCDKFKIPRIILKVPFDKVGEETKNFDYKKAIDLLEKNIDYKILLEKIGDYLDKIPTKSDLSKYYDYYKMTHSEKLIFEIKYNKYKTLTGDNFDNFFDKNKWMSKKEFLNIL